MTNNKNDVKLDKPCEKDQETFVQMIKEMIAEELKEYKKKIEKNIYEIKTEHSYLETYVKDIARIVFIDRDLLKTIINTIGCSSKELEVIDENSKQAILNFGILSPEEYENLISIRIFDRLSHIKKRSSTKEKNLNLILDAIKKVRGHKLSTTQIVNLCLVDERSARRYMKILVERSRYPGEVYKIVREKDGRGKPKLYIMLTNPNKE